jgi:hypothetical protein
MLSIRPGDLQDLELLVIDVFMLFDEVSRMSKIHGYTVWSILQYVVFFFEMGIKTSASASY